MSTKLDVLVAERVMAVKPNPQIKYAIESADGSYFTVEPYKPYSSFIAAAWEVVEKVPGECVIERWPEFKGTWRCSFNRNHEWQRADTAPLAICLAALKACAVPESEIEEAMKDG